MAPSNPQLDGALLLVYVCHILHTMRLHEVLRRCTGFDWDDGNTDKNWAKHRVSDAEGEQTFFNRPLLVIADHAHSQGEGRFFALGTTDSGRRLFVAFTVREDRIRIISARDMTRSETQEYERHAKRHPPL